MSLFNLSDKLVVNIASYLDRSEQFTTMNEVCKDGHRIFNLKNYFSPATDRTMPHKWKMFESDCQYFTENEESLLADKRQTLVLSEDKVLKDNNSATMTAYLATNYSRLLQMERRYRYAMGNHTFSGIHTVFPQIMKGLLIKPSMESSKPISNKFAEWIGFSVLRRLEAQTHFRKIDFSFARMDDNAMSLVTAGIICRDHLLNLTHFYLINNPKVSDNSMKCLFTALGLQCPKIRKVNLAGCGITDATVFLSIIFHYQFFNVSQPSSLPTIVWENTAVSPNAVQQFMAMMASRTVGPDYETV